MSDIPSKFLEGPADYEADTGEFAHLLFLRPPDRAPEVRWRGAKHLPFRISLDYLHAITSDGDSFEVALSEHLPWPVQAVDEYEEENWPSRSFRRLDAEN